MEENRYVCPYCGTPVGKDEVLFWEKVKTMYTDNVRGNFLRHHGVRSAAGNKFPRMYYRVQESNIVSVDESGFPTMIEDHLGNALAPEELEKASKTDHGNGFDEDFDSDDYGESRDERNSSQNREIHNIPKRACPHCHCELPRQFGTIPTHHIAMMGGRAAGKTAYLVNLFQQINAQLGANDLGSVTLAEESKAFLQPMIEEYEQTGTTSPTPADRGLLPILCCYKNRGNEAFLTFYDIAGEGTGDAAYMANHKGIANCEGMLLMIDPNMFVSGAFNDQWVAEHMAEEDQLGGSEDCCKDSLDSFLNQAGELCREYADKIRYVVCVITKLDMMLEAEAKYFGAGDIELLTDVKNKHHGAVNLGILKEINSELRAYLEKKQQIKLKDKLIYTFGDNVKINILGVSTSTRAPGKEIRFEPNSAAVESKHRIIEPFLVILMYFGLAPAKKPDGGIIYFHGGNSDVQDIESVQTAHPATPEKPKKGLFGLFRRG